jgi:ABC-2 type transport system ATP-binding protein
MSIAEPVPPALDGAPAPQPARTDVRPEPGAMPGASRTSQTPIIEVVDLVKVYGKGEKSTRAVDGITFDVAPGTLFGLLGPNGAGKTTIIRILATLLQPTSGTARVAGLDVSREPHEVRRRLGLALQTVGLDAFLDGS